LKKILLTIPPDAEYSAALEQSGRYRIDRVDKTSAEWTTGDSTDAGSL